jgi:ribonuclease R
VQSPEEVFSFDGNGGVADAWLEGEPHAHMLVEELMILANECVGAFLSARNRAALYRVHERPDPKAVEHLIAKLADLGVPTPPVPDPLTPQLAATVAGEASKLVTAYAAQAGRGKEAFPSLVLRALKQARYDPKNLGHAGLASSAYCHFTSPIRRYPDLVVHRALLRELGLADEPLPEDLQHLAEHASERERAAAQIEYAADAICLSWLLERRLYELGWDEEWEGEIIGVIASGIFVRFGEVFEGFLPARRLQGEYFELNDLATAMRGRTTGRTYRLGDGITIRVERISRNDGKVELTPA